MNRRGFLQSLVGGIATATAVRTWPFRVYSFPTEPQIFTVDEFRNFYVQPAVDALLKEWETDFAFASGITWDQFARANPIGSKVTVRLPQRFLAASD